MNVPSRTHRGGRAIGGATAKCQPFRVAATYGIFRAGIEARLRRGANAIAPTDKPGSLNAPRPPGPALDRMKERVAPPGARPAPAKSATPETSASDVSLEVQDGTVLVRFAARHPAIPKSIGLLVDDAVVAMAKVIRGPGGAKPPSGATATVSLPPWHFGDTLQLVAIPDGTTLLPMPFNFTPMRSVEWLGWKIEKRRVLGAFRPSADIGPVPIPVQLMQDNILRQTCFALRDDRGIWRFDTPLRRVAGPNARDIYHPRIGGMDVAEPLVVTNRDCGVTGHVDLTADHAVHGWAVDLTDATRRVELEIAVQGKLFWRGQAKGLRADVRTLGYGDGRVGFRVPLPPDMPRNQPIHVAVTIADSGVHLVNSPYTVKATPRYLGYLDGLDGPFANGWVVDMATPGTPLAVEAVCGGDVVGSGIANLYRGDVEQAGMPTARCGFRFLLTPPLASLFGRDIYLRITGTDQILDNSPLQISQNSNIVRFLTRSTAVPLPTIQRLARRMTHQTAGLTISILMPIYNTRREWLIEALNSVLGQWSANWELICVDDGSTDPHVREILDAASQHDPRIRVMRAPGNQGIARAINFGLRAARGDYVAFMDHDDTIEPDAVFKLAEAALQTSADLVYSDEAITAEDIGSVIEVRARPAFSHDYYLAHPYFVHLVCVRTEIARRLGGWDETLAHFRRRGLRPARGRAGRHRHPHPPRPVSLAHPQHEHRPRKAGRGHEHDARHPVPPPPASRQDGHRQARPALQRIPGRLAGRRGRGADRHPHQEPRRPPEDLHRQHREDLGRRQLPHRGHRPPIDRQENHSLPATDRPPGTPSCPIAACSTTR